MKHIMKDKKEFFKASESELRTIIGMIRHINESFMQSVKLDDSVIFTVFNLKSDCEDCRKILENVDLDFHKSPFYAIAITDKIHDKFYVIISDEIHIEIFRGYTFIEFKCDNVNSHKMAPAIAISDSWE